MANLDEALRDWSQQRALNEAGVDRLMAGIQQRVADEVTMVTRDAVVVTHLATSSERADGRFNKWGAFAAVACVFLLLGVAVGRRISRTDGEARIEVASTTEASALLLKEMDRLFEGRWTCLGEVNGQTFVEATDRVDSDVESRPRVAVNLVAVERCGSESTWRVVWKATVVTRSQEWVRVPERVAGGDSVAVWVYALPDGAVMVESELALRGERGIEVSTGKLFPKSPLDRHRVVELWTERRGDRELRVLEATQLVML